jgi:hypothetical protein
MEGMFRRIGLIVGAILFVAGVASCGQESRNQNTQSNSRATAEAQPADQIKALEQALGPNDVKSFGGSDTLPIGGPLASISVPQSEDEKRFLAEYGCIDEVDCYGREKFERFILKTYPDIARVHFKVPPEMAGEEKEDIAFKRQDFRRGLYFAKRITLANGMTLFDLLTKCSKTVEPFNWAEAVYDSKTNEPYFPMQFFPVLRQDATGDGFEADILLDRRGNWITARSPAFSSSILRDADFMNKHGLSCWHAL